MYSYFRSRCLIVAVYIVCEMGVHCVFTKNSQKRGDLAVSGYGARLLDYHKVRVSNVIARDTTLVVNLRERFSVLFIVVPIMWVSGCW